MESFERTNYVASTMSIHEKEDVKKFATSLVKSVLSFALITMLFGVICSCIVINRGTTYGSHLDISLGSISLVFLFIFLVLFFVMVAKFGSIKNMFQPWIDSLSAVLFSIRGQATISKVPKQKPEIEMTSFTSSSYTPSIHNPSTQPQEDLFSSYGSKWF